MVTLPMKPAAGSPGRAPRHQHSRNGSSALLRREKCSSITQYGSVQQIRTAGGAQETTSETIPLCQALGVDGAHRNYRHERYPRATEPLWHEWDRKAMKCGLRHKVFAVNGDEYTGEWQNNLKHGKGIQLWKRTKAIYSGEWKFGKRDGYGLYRIPDPVTKEYKVYLGYWKNDKKCGYGETFCPGGEHYEGEWSEGLRSGWGQMSYRDGSAYEGQWLEDQYHGQGTLKLSNENWYEGGWRHGKKHGPGKFFFLDKGQLFEGIWVKGIPKCGVLTDFGRDEAPAPPRYPIPKLELADAEAVLAEARALFDDSQGNEMLNGTEEQELELVTDWNLNPLMHCPALDSVSKLPTCLTL